MPRAATSYRIGGEACSPEALQAEARAAFLDVAAELYHVVLDELLALGDAPGVPELRGVPSRAIRAWLEAWADPPAGWDALLQAVGDWAHRWRLLDRGRPPEWLVEVALFTLACCRRSGLRLFELPDCGRMVQTRSDRVILPPVPAPPKLPAGLQRVLTFESRDGRGYVSCRFYPEFQGAGRVKRTLREYSGWVLRLWGTSAEKACRRIDELVAQALAAGAVPGEWHADREPLDWAVKATVGGMTYEAIAAREWRVSPDTVAKHVKRLLRLIGVRRVPNRPTK
jgi:hypothetical protein